MDNPGAGRIWRPAAAIILFITAAALGVGAIFFGPDLFEQAAGSVSVLEERPEITTQLALHLGGEFTVADRVSYGERSLSVGIRKPEGDVQDPDDSRQVAQRAAKIAFDAHPQAAELTHVSVQFLTTSRLGPIRWEENSDPYRFTPEELTD
ncbi:hypothetical protein ABI59_07485 [Acidobacteria bacterium Mor1]|nr:hypothetical protein ABI59_07485 [Acidobacteria bacterium Mor1]